MLDLNIDNLKFREDDNLENCIYNIELYVKLLNILQDILCPIETEKDFDFAIKYYNEIKNIKTELNRNNIHQSILLLQQFQETTKINFYLEKVKKSFNNIHERWKHYYNDTIFEKAQHDYIYWNESPLKPIINQTDSEFSSFKIFLDTFENKTKPTVIALEITKTNTSEIKKEDNLHNNIFSNNGFELFSYILENYIAKGRGRFADVSYYYWRMYEDTPQFIHQRPEPFKNWFCQTYQENFEKIKTLNEVTDQKGNRNKHYSTSLDWFNNQS